MKKLLTLLTLLMVALACNSNRHLGATAVGIVNLEHYAAKNSLDLPYDFNYVVITNQTDFDATFGITTSGNINITYPGFGEKTVVACIAQPANSKVTIRFDKAEVAGKAMNVYCSTSKITAPLKHTIIPVAVATVPTVMDVKKVNFIANGEKVAGKPVIFNDAKPVQAVKKTEVVNKKPVVLKKTLRRPAVI